MLRIHASLAAAVDGSSDEANATKTARATDARFIGISFRHQRESCGAREDRKRRLYADASTSVADLLPSVSPVTTVTVPSKPCFVRCVERRMRVLLRFAAAIVFVTTPLIAQKAPQTFPLRDAA